MFAQNPFVAMAKPRPRMAQILPEAAPTSEAIFAQLHSLAESINIERGLDAAAFAEYTAVGKSHLDAVDAAGKAEKVLAEQEKIWERGHLNAGALAAAQAAVDNAHALEASTTDDVNAKRLEVQSHNVKITKIRGDVDDLIGSLPTEMQTDAHKIIDPCWKPRMQGSEPVRIKKPAMSPIQSLMGAPRPTSVTLAGMYRPSFGSPVLMPAGNFRPQAPQVPVFAAYRPRSLGQNSLVTVNPNVQLTIQTGIEKYMFPVGLMAGGAASFLIGSVIPESFRPITTVLGLGLVGWGVFVLIKGGTGSSAPGPATPPPSPTGAAAAAASPTAFTPPTVSAFSRLQFELVSPKPDQTIEHLGNIFTSDRIPVVVRMYNPTAETVTFNLDFEWDEFPSMIGYNRAPNHGSKAFQMTLGPNEEKNEPFELPYQSSGFATSAMSVNLAIYKKRTPDENPMLISNTTFNVS